MKIKTIHYKRTKNLGNYENETFEMTAEIDEGDDALKSAEQLQEYVLYMLGIDQEITEKIYRSKDSEELVGF